MQQIERGIYYEDVYLGVTLGALVFSHGVIAIDAPLRAEDARSWRSALLNQRGGPNRLLICLDAHPDRTLGARALDCPIVAHQKTAQIFRNRPTIFKGQSLESGAIWETYNDAIGTRWAFPDITFTQRMSLHWGGPETIIEHRPGPTSGSSWIVVPEAQVVFVGDAVVLNQPPFFAYADMNAWLENLDALMTTFRGYTIISGRGGIAAGEDVRFQRKILEEVLNELEKLSRSTISQETIQVLITSLLSHYKIPSEMREGYTQRLRNGLYHCAARRYRIANILGPSEMETEEI
jgi:cyclase